MPNSSNSDTVRILMRDWDNEEKVVETHNISKRLITKHSFFFKNIQADDIAAGSVDLPAMAHFTDFIQYLREPEDDLNDILETELRRYLESDVNMDRGTWLPDPSFREIAHALEFLISCWKLGSMLGAIDFTNAAMESLLDIPIGDNIDVFPVMIKDHIDGEAHRGTALQRWAMDWIAAKAEADHVDALQEQWSEHFVRDLLKRIMRLREPGEFWDKWPDLEDKAMYQHDETEESYGKTFSSRLSIVRASAAAGN